MTREQAIDIVWALAIAQAPIGADLPNDPEHYAAAVVLLAGVGRALEVLGVDQHELGAAQQRYELALAAIADGD